MSRKSRDLPILDYYEILQKEYIVAELRRKIYPSKSDKDYYERVMDGKKEKIDDIAARNGLPSIFTDDDMKKRYYNEVYGDSYPDFVYKSDREEEQLKPKDRDNYYQEGEDFKIVTGEDDFKFGTLISIDHDKEVAKLKVRYEEKMMTAHVDNIQRIL